MLKDKLGLDDKDVLIVSRLTRNPELSQADLAVALKLSQPSINARLHKLREKGILASQLGIEITRSDMCFARVDFTAVNANKILEGIKGCSFFVNGFIMSGKNNASLLLVGHDLKKVEAIIDRHLRSNPDIRELTMNVVVSAIKPFISPVDLEQEAHEECMTPDHCHDCKLHSHETLVKVKEIKTR